MTIVASRTLNQRSKIVWVKMFLAVSHSNICISSHVFHSCCFRVCKFSLLWTSCLSIILLGFWISCLRPSRLKKLKSVREVKASAQRKKKNDSHHQGKIVNDNHNQLIKFNNDFSPHPAYPACHRYHRVWIVDGCQSLCDAQVEPSTVMKPPHTYNYFSGDLI